MSAADNEEIKFFDKNGQEIRHVHKIHRVHHERPTSPSGEDDYTVSYSLKSDRERIITAHVAPFSYKYAKEILRRSR